MGKIYRLNGTACGCSYDSCRVDCSSQPDGFCCIDHTTTNRLIQVLGGTPPVTQQPPAKKWEYFNGSCLQSDCGDHLTKAECEAIHIPCGQLGTWSYQWNRSDNPAWNNYTIRGRRLETFTIQTLPSTYCYLYGLTHSRWLVGSCEPQFKQEWICANSIGFSVRNFVFTPD